MKKAHIDENNKLLGWYDTEIHAVIPEPNIDVTDEQWQNSINNNHNKVDNRSKNIGLIIKGFFFHLRLKFCYFNFYCIFAHHGNMWACTGMLIVHMPHAHAHCTCACARAST